MRNSIKSKTSAASLLIPHSIFLIYYGNQGLWYVKFVFLELPNTSTVEYSYNR